jgi:hypothetical protein
VRVGLLSKRRIDATGRGAIRQRGADWLVGRICLSAESISLVLAGGDNHPPTEIKQEVPELQPA